MSFEFPKPENKPAGAEKRKAEKLAKLASIRKSIEELAALPTFCRILGCWV